MWGSGVRDARGEGGREDRRTSLSETESPLALAEGATDVVLRDNGHLTDEEARCQCRARIGRRRGRRGLGAGGGDKEISVVWCKKFIPAERAASSHARTPTVGRTKMFKASCVVAVARRAEDDAEEARVCI